MQWTSRLLVGGLLALAFLAAAELIFAQADPTADPSASSVAPPAGQLHPSNRSASSLPQHASSAAARPIVKLRGDAYSFTLAQIYDAHAYDHTRVLRHYAASGEPVPSEVIREEAAAISRNTRAALECYTKLSDKTRSDPKLLTQLAAIDKRHQEILASCRKLDEAAQLEKEIEAEAVTTQAGEIGAGLRDAYAASTAAGGDQLQQQLSAPGRCYFSD